MPSVAVLQQSLGIVGKQNASRLPELCRVARVKCLTVEPERMPPPFIQTRSVYGVLSVPISYFVYGNRYVIVQQESDKSFGFVIYKAAQIAYNHRKRFYELWSDAIPTAYPESDPKPN
jgi:hypothetical protein